MKRIETIKTNKGQDVTLGVVENDETGARCYYMSGPTGRHELAISETDEERLAAHWSGFCQMNDVKNAAMVKAETTPAMIKANHALQLEVDRCNYLVELVVGRLQNWDQLAGTFKGSWGDHGDAEHFRARLLDLVADDDKRDALLAEIDQELDGDESDELGLAEFDRVQTS